MYRQASAGQYHFAQSGRKAAAGHRAVLFVLLLPVAVHLGATVLSFRGSGWIKFGWPDFGVQVIMLVYLAVVLCCRTHARLLPRLALMVSALALSIGVAEVGARWVRPLPPPNLPQVPQRHVSLAGTALPGVRGNVAFTVNELGLRGRPMTLAELRRTDHKILCLGASTTQSIGVSDEHAWPELLNQKLSKRLPGSVYVGNAGVQGYASPHCATLLRDYAPAAEFDWVVVLCVYPDVVTMFKGSFDQRRRSARQALTPGHQHRPYYSRSSLYHWLRAALRPEAPPVDAMVGNWSAWMERARARRRMLQERGVIEAMPARLEEGLVDYRHNLQAIIRTCRKRGQGVLLLTHAQIHATRDLPPDLQRQLGGGWYDDSGVLAGEITQVVVGRYNTLLKQVAAEHDIDVVDLDALLPKDATTFFDDYHLNNAGCARVATLLADYFVPALTATRRDAVAAHRRGSR